MEVSIVDSAAPAAGNYFGLIFESIETSVGLEEFPVDGWLAKLAGISFFKLYSIYGDDIFIINFGVLQFEEVIFTFRRANILSCISISFVIKVISESPKGKGLVIIHFLAQQGRCV